MPTPPGVRLGTGPLGFSSSTASVTYTSTTSSATASTTASSSSSTTSSHTVGSNTNLVQIHLGGPFLPDGLGFPHDPEITVGPNRDEILNGKVVTINQTSDVMPGVRQKLTGLGMGAGVGLANLHDEQTAQQIFMYKAQLQRQKGDCQINPFEGINTEIDSETLLSLESDAVTEIAPATPDAAPATDLSRYNAQAGESLLAAARRRLRDGSTTGRCYYDVKRAVNSVYGPLLSGLSAYMAADQLAASPYFQELRGSQQELRAQLASLPAGAVVVWGPSPDPNVRARNRDSGYNHGHISIADGQGYEISDHRELQMNPHYAGGEVRIFLPTARAGTLNPSGSGSAASSITAPSTTAPRTTG